MEPLTAKPAIDRDDEPTTSSATAPPRQRVRVWFGRHVICTHTADREHARRYVAMMRRRFAGLRVTTESVTSPNSDVGDSHSVEPASLPVDTRLWPLTVR